MHSDYSAAEGATFKKGDTVFLGSYEQDDNPANGNEPMEWLILKVKDGKALLISKYALDCQPYHTSDNENTWEKCSLRAWLNDTFLNAAFTKKSTETNRDHNCFCR